MALLNGCSSCPAPAVYFGPWGNACQTCALGLLVTREGSAADVAALQADLLQQAEQEARAEDAARTKHATDLAMVAAGVKDARLRRELNGLAATMP